MIRVLMRTIWTSAALLVIITAGCQSLALTPQQEQVLDQFAACRGEGPTVNLAEVQSNGQFTLTGAHSHIELVKRCLSERFGYARWGDPRIQEQIFEPTGGS